MNVEQALREAMSALDLTLWSASGAHVFNSDAAIRDLAASLEARLPRAALSSEEAVSPAPRPSKAEVAAMTADEMNAWLESCGATVRVAEEAVSPSLDADLGRNFRAALDGLAPDWRVGFIRNGDGWRSVLLAPDSGQPVAVTDAPTIDALFSAVSPEPPT